MAHSLEACDTCGTTLNENERLLDELMKTEPYASVDSGQLLIIDPCYLTQVLRLTHEQEDRFRDMLWEFHTSKQRISTLPVAHAAKGILIKTRDGDGIYFPWDIVNELEHKDHEQPTVEQAEAL